MVIPPKTWAKLPDSVWTVENHLENPRTTLSVFFAPKFQRRHIFWFTRILGFSIVSTSQPLVFTCFYHVASGPCDSTSEAGSLGFCLPGRTGPAGCGSSCQATWRKELTTCNKTGESEIFFGPQSGPTSLMISFFNIGFFTLCTWEKWSNLTTISWRTKTCRQHGWVWLHEDASLFGGGDV